LSTPQSIQSTVDDARTLEPPQIWPNPFPLDPFHNLARAVIQFDVETVSPLQRIFLRPYAYSLRTWPDEPILYFRNELSLFVNGDRDRVLLDHGPDDLESPTYDVPQFQGRVGDWYLDSDFEPVSKMTIVTDMLFMSGWPHEAQLLHFDVTAIPEPGLISVVVLASTIVLVRFRTRRRVV
jgi:hypothetical protein